MTNPPHIETQHLIDLALKEDLADMGDLTSQFFIPAEHQSTALIVTREPIVVAGLQSAQNTFQTVDPELDIKCLCTDGDAIQTGQSLMSIHGSTRSLLTGERTALNFLQRLCGIATVTRSYVEAAKNSSAEILDTRKTTPAWRQLEKAAVAAGGGRNHRMGLYDAVMVKDNHLVAGNATADISDAIQRARQHSPDICIELEVDTLEQLQRYLNIPGIDIILLDNMPPALLTQAVEIKNKLAASVKLEASGGITLDTIPSIAATGVDFISVGALTHSVRSVDLSLELQPNV